MGHVMGTGDCCVPRDIFLNEIQKKGGLQGEPPNIKGGLNRCMRWTCTEVEGPT